MNFDEGPNTGVAKNDPASKEVRALVPFREKPRMALAHGEETEIFDEQPRTAADYWAMLRDRIWLIAACTLVVTTLAVLYVARQPDVFQAESGIQVDLEDNPALGSTKERSVIINDQADNPAYFNTQLMLLKSPAFLRRVAKTLDLQHDSAFLAGGNRARGSMWRNILGLLNLGESRPQPEVDPDRSLRSETIAPASPDGDIAEAQKLEPYVGRMRSGLDVKLTESTRLISIGFSHGDPRVAARVANAVADTFVQANWERRGATNSSASEFLQKRVAELQLKIGENERKLLDYARDHQILPLDSGRDIEADRLAALDKSVLEAENQRKFAESEYHAALAPGAAAALVEGSNNVQLTTVSARLSELRQKREVMLLEAGENWPEVKELNKQIGNLEQELKETREHAVRVVLTNLELRYRQALAREQSLRKGFDEAHNQVMSADSAAINYRMIQQETTTYKGLLENLLQRSKENDIILAGTPNNVHVTDYATLPVRLIGPKRLSIVAIAFAGALLFSVALALALGSAEDSAPVNSTDGVERLFGLPTLAVLPSASAGRRKPRIFRRRKAQRDDALLIYQDPRSPMAESYRKLRTSVALSAAGNPPRTMLITSNMPDEGKTTAVVNLGLVMSRTNGKVLLIDADLRHPCLHDVLGVNNSRGLRDILSSDCRQVDIQAMIEQYGETDLYVLPAGPSSDYPAELLDSRRMRELLASLSSAFSHIIIDSPPMSHFTDGVVLSSMVDAVLLVVRGPKSPRQVARHSMNSLEAVGAPVLGVLLNDVNLQSNNHRYYQYYYGRFNDSTNGNGSTAPEW